MAQSRKDEKDVRFFQSRGERILNSVLNCSSIFDSSGDSMKNTAGHGIDNRSTDRIPTPSLIELEDTNYNEEDNRCPDSSPAPSLTELEAMNPWIDELMNDELIPSECLSPSKSSFYNETSKNDIEGTNIDSDYAAADEDEDEDSGDPSYFPKPGTSGNNSSSDEDSISSIQVDSTSNIEECDEPVRSSTISNSLVPYSDSDESDCVLPKGKKRVRREETWKKNVRKFRRLGGKKYLSVTGKEQSTRSIKPPCKNCRLKCTENFSEAVRCKINSEFWSSERSWECKRQFVNSCVSVKEIQRRRPAKENSLKKRSKSIDHFFKLNDVDIKVCKAFFLSTLSISETFLRNSLAKISEVGLVTEERRGKHEPCNKTSQKIIDGIKKHINKYPRYESHYSREKTNRLYLGHHLNISIMYRNYIEECKNDGSDIGKEWLFRKIFNENFNISFKLPDNDTCDKCDLYACQLKNAKTDEESRSIKSELTAHQIDAETRYKLKKNDKLEEKDNTSIKVVMADLQKCLPTPNLSNAQSFYLRKLWTLNYTIHNSKKTYCMLWDEATAGRGGNEIASCFYTWAIQAGLKDDKDLEKLIVWTDSCPGQNRNLMMVLMYMTLLNVSVNLKEINHKFLLRGHTHMEVDSDHSIIERATRQAPSHSIFTCNDWVNLIANAKKTKPTFSVVRMILTNFLSFTSLIGRSGPLVQRKQCSDGSSFQISSAVWLQVRKADPGKLFFKTSFEENEFKSVDLVRNRRKGVSFPSDLPQIRKQKKNISDAKFNDLQVLLQWIPEEYHGFFQSLPHGNVDNDFLDEI